MAWQNTLLDASFRGVGFQVKATGDDIERSVIVYEYPYVDGANVEDMGRVPRRVMLTAVFYGEDYENRLQALLDALDVPGAGPLIHPVFGELQAQFVRTHVPHEASAPDYTELSLEFLEKKLNAPLFSRQLPVQHVNAVNKAADDALAAARDGFQVDIKNALNLPALLRDKLSTDMLGAIDTMKGYADQLVEARGWIASGLHYLDNPTAFVDDVAGGLLSRTNALYSSLDFLRGSSGGGSGSARGSLAAAWREPQAHLQQPVFSGAPMPVAPLTSDPAAVQPFLVTHVAVQQSLAIAGAAARLYSADLDATVLTPADIENVAADVRTTLKDAITLVRRTYPDIVRSRPITEPLKSVALAITDAAEQLIRAKPPLRARVVDTPGNLHLLAHLWYGDQRRAAELQRLNPKVRNPNFIAAGVTLLAYAE